MTVAAYYSQCSGCGAITFAAVDRPEYRKDLAKDIAAVVRSGRTVQYTGDLELIRLEISGCKCKSTPPQQEES